MTSSLCEYAGVFKPFFSFTWWNSACSLHVHVHASYTCLNMYRFTAAFPCIAQWIRFCCSHEVLSSKLAGEPVKEIVIIQVRIQLATCSALALRAGLASKMLCFGIERESILLIVGSFCRFVIASILSRRLQEYQYSSSVLVVFDLLQRTMRPLNSVSQCTACARQAGRDVKIRRCSRCFRLGYCSPYVAQFTATY